VGGLPRPRSNPRAVGRVEVSRTLVRSAPEIYSQLEREALERAVGPARIQVAEPERALTWHADGASGTARLEPSGWGTRVTLTAEIEERVAERGIWQRLTGEPPAPPAPAPPDLEERLTGLLDALGADHKKPFQRE
jgi:hypothetical protein